jgi:hypothetical protein
MLLVPGASAAVEKLAVPPLSVAVSRMLPLLVSVKITEPAGVPLGALTWAVNITGESYVLEAGDAVSAVVVAVAAVVTVFGSGAAVAAAGCTTGLMAAAMLTPMKTRWRQRTSATSRWSRRQRSHLPRGVLQFANPPIMA